MKELIERILQVEANAARRVEEAHQKAREIVQKAQEEAARIKIEGEILAKRSASEKISRVKEAMFSEKEQAIARAKKMYESQRKERETAILEISEEIFKRIIEK